MLFLFRASGRCCYGFLLSIQLGSVRLYFFFSLYQSPIEALGLHSVSISFLLVAPSSFSAIMYFSILAMTSYFFSLAHGAALQSRAFTGQATFYGGNLQGGACSFSTYTLPSGIHGTALSDSNWGNSGSCGACVSVTGPGGQSIRAMVNTPLFHFCFPLRERRMLKLYPDRR